MAAYTKETLTDAWWGWKTCGSEEWEQGMSQEPWEPQWGSALTPGCGPAASEHGRVLPAKTGSTDSLRQGEGMNWVKPWAAGAGVRDKAGAEEIMWVQEVHPGDVLETGSYLCCNSGQNYVPWFEWRSWPVGRGPTWGCSGQLRTELNAHSFDVNGPPPSEEGGYCWYLLLC